MKTINLITTTATVLSLFLFSCSSSTENENNKSTENEVIESESGNNSSTEEETVTNGENKETSSTAELTDEIIMKEAKAEFPKKAILKPIIFNIGSSKFTSDKMTKNTPEKVAKLMKVLISKGYFIEKRMPKYSCLPTDKLKPFIDSSKDAQKRSSMGIDFSYKAYEFAIGEYSLGNLMEKAVVNETEKNASFAVSFKANEFYNILAEYIKEEYVVTNAVHTEYLFRFAYENNKWQNVSSFSNFVGAN